MSCINCSKKRPCCFKSCTLDKSNVLKEYITNRLEQKERLQEELIMIIDPVETLKLQITEKEDRLIKLRLAIQETKQRKIIKTKEVKKLNSIIKFPVQSKDVFLSQSEYLKNLTEKIEEKKKQLKIAEQTLAKVRMECFQQVFRIFPIKIHIVTESNSFEDWVIVNDTDHPQQEQITIRSSRISGNPFTNFKEELAAFSHTFQLVKILIMIFNFSPPKRLSSLKDLGSGDGKMTKDSLWISLCDTVIHLCAHIGVPMDKLESSNPYRNLIEMTTFLGSDPANFMMI